MIGIKILFNPKTAKRNITYLIILNVFCFKFYIYK